MPRPDALGPRTLAGGALLAALALVLGLAAYYLPVVGAALTFVTPLPVAVAYLRYGWRVSVLTTAVADLLALIVGGPLVGVFVLFGCLIGISLGYGIGREWPGGRTIVLSGIVGFLGTLGTLAVSLLVLGPHLIDQMFDLTTEMFAAVEAALESAGPGTEQLAQQLAQTTALVLANPWPFLLLSFLLGGFMYAYVWYAVCAPALVRLGFAAPPLPRVAPVAAWRLPPPAGLACMAGYLGLALYARFADPAIVTLPWAIWLLALVTLPVTVQGIGLAAYMLSRSPLPAAMRRPLVALLVIAAFLTPLGALVLFWTGLADLALDLRGYLRSKQRLEAGE